MTEVGSVYVSILPSAKGFGSKLDRELSGGADQAGRRAGKRAGEGVNRGMAAPLAKITGALAGAFVVDRAVTFFKDAVAGASDLSESTSKVGVVFGKNSTIVTRFAEDAARSMGITKQAALEASGTLGNLFVALDLPQRAAAKMSTRMVKLASDLASFNNVDPDEALLALRSGLLGEAEPLRKFGVSLSQVRIEAEALSSGLVKPTINVAKLALAQKRASLAQVRLTDAVKKHGKSSKEAQSASIAFDVATQNVKKAMEGQKVELTAAQKAQAAYSIIMKDTALAQGDFSRTSGGLANQQRILSAQWSDLKAKIGTELLPVMTHLARFTNDEIIPAISGFVDGIQNGTGAGGKFADVVGDLGDQAKAAWHLAEPLLSYIGEHPHLFAEVAKDAAIFAVALKGISTVKKLPGLGSLLGGGKGGLLGQAATLAKPLPVFVTNAGIGGKGTGGLPTILGGGRGTVPEGRFGKILASNLTAQAVLLGDVVLGAKAASGLKEVIFPLRFNLSVNNAAKDFLAQIDSPETDKRTRAILQRHFDAVWAGVAESTRSGNTKALQQALNETYADLAKNDAAIQQQIAKEAAANTLRNAQLISDGLLSTQKTAEAMSREVATSLTTGLGGGLGRARERSEDLKESLGGVHAPVINKNAITTPLQGGVDKAHEFLLTLTQVDKIQPDVTITGIDPAVQKANELFRKLERLEGLRVTSYAQVVASFTHDPSHGDSDYQHRAGGGRMRSGVPYIWAEPSTGGELFVPDVNGTAMNSRQLAAALGAMPVSGAGGLTIERLEVVSAPQERAETSVPRGLQSMLFAAGFPSNG